MKILMMLAQLLALCTVIESLDDQDLQSVIDGEHGVALIATTPVPGGYFQSSILLRFCILFWIDSKC